MSAEPIRFVEKLPEENHIDFRDLYIDQFFHDKDDNFCQKTADRSFVVLIDSKGQPHHNAFVIESNMYPVGNWFFVKKIRNIDTIIFKN